MTPSRQYKRHFITALREWTTVHCIYIFVFIKSRNYFMFIYLCHRNIIYTSIASGEACMNLHSTYEKSIYRQISERKSVIKVSRMSYSAMARFDFYQEQYLEKNRKISECIGNKQHDNVEQFLPFFRNKLAIETRIKERFCFRARKCSSFYRMPLQRKTEILFLMSFC